MVYNDLGGSTAHSLNMLLQNARQRLALDPRFWVKEFGGIERVQALEQMLSSLKSAGVLLYICSFNDDSVILEALYHLGLLQFFAGVNGNPNILSSKLGDKGMRVRQAIQAVAARPERTMFIDDSERNCIQVTNVNPGVCPYNCKETGLNTRDMMQIVEWFKASGEGN
jgi:predicted phosphatase